MKTSYIRRIMSFLLICLMILPFVSCAQTQNGGETTPAENAATQAPVENGATEGTVETAAEEAK